MFKPLNMLLLFSFRCPIVIPSAASRAALNLHQLPILRAPVNGTDSGSKANSQELTGLHLI